VDPPAKRFAFRCGYATHTFGTWGPVHALLCFVRMYVRTYVCHLLHYPRKGRPLQHVLPLYLQHLTSSFGALTQLGCCKILLFGLFVLRQVQLKINYYSTLWWVHCNTQMMRKAESSMNESIRPLFRII
jgi:hypothetical protein